MLMCLNKIIIITRRVYYIGDNFLLLCVIHLHMEMNLWRDGILCVVHKQNTKIFKPSDLSAVKSEPSMKRRCYYTGRIVEGQVN